MSPRVAVALGAVGLLAVPGLAWALDDPFLVSLFTNVAILALAAVALDFILGYGAMISLGHAAFFGLGGYCVGILAHHAGGDAGSLLGLGLLGLDIGGTNSALWSLPQAPIWLTQSRVAK